MTGNLNLMGVGELAKRLGITAKNAYHIAAKSVFEKAASRARVRCVPCGVLNGSAVRYLGPHTVKVDHGLPMLVSPRNTERIHADPG
jgi:hypothetical protein